MSEVCEGTPTGPIRDNIQAAKEALQEGNEAPRKRNSKVYIRRIKPPN